MLYRYFTKTDGFKIFLKDEDIIGYEEMEDHVVIISVIGDYEVINTIEEIFKEPTNKNKFSDN